MKIEIENLSKKYKNDYALKDITFTLDQPKIYGLLGRNGAGKTTLMEILSGHILASEGEILINGEKPFDNRKLTESICLIKEGDNFKKDLLIQNILKIYEYFYPSWNQPLAEQLLETFQLQKKARVKTLSKGMESALGIIVGLASHAPITIFDEPYIGLDAAARKKFYQLLLEAYEEDERTIILSTHLIDEVSLLFEEVVILKKGKLVLKENTDQLRDLAYKVTGKKDQIRQFIQEQKVLHVEELAGMMTAYLMGDAKEAKSLGLSVEGIPIQDLMIYLTESEGELYQ